jgi:hypothetical protein
MLRKTIRELSEIGARDLAAVTGTPVPGGRAPMVSVVAKNELQVGFAIAMDFLHTGWQLRTEPYINYPRLRKGALDG